MSGTQARWILAFDASCGTCRGISRAVAEACDGKLKLMPLAHPDVRQWREQSLGSQAAWVPTLIRIQADDVRAWTGPAMVVALVRHLGSRSTMRVLGALMQQRRNRRQVVPLGVGPLAVVGSLMMTSRRGGRGPEQEDPRSWVEANRDRLPRSYDEIITYAIPYRKAIFGALSPELRSQLWVEHLNRYRVAHPGLSADQTEIIDRAVALVPAVFMEEQDQSEELRRLGEAAKQAFGDEAGPLLATLGPSDSEPAAPGDCDCSTFSDWCVVFYHCDQDNRCPQDGVGCGTLYAFPCNGSCN